MTWSGRRDERRRARAARDCSFDQHTAGRDGDAPLHAERNRAALPVWTVADRPEASIAAAARMNDAATDDARAKIRQELVDSGLVGGKTRHVRR